MTRFASRGAALAIMAALALPGGALAQGAGDNQYQDPFAGNDGSSRGSGKGTSGTGSRGRAGGGTARTGSGSSGSGSSGGGGGQLSTTPPNSNETQATQTRTPRGELARTGAEPGLIALLGTGLLLTGAGLRVRVRRPLA
jgi:hypothetical protein